jgi:AcrR family transcriptional regulator
MDRGHPTGYDAENDGRNMNARDDDLTVISDEEWAGLRPGATDQAAAEAMYHRIAETAERLFRQYGYQKTTVADIAAELRMSPANVYRFFASKAAITEAVARRVTADTQARIREAIAEPGLTASERLRRTVKVMQGCITQRCIADNRMHAMVHAAIDQNWGVIQAHKENIRRIMAGIIADGIASGEFDVPDADEAAACFQAALISSCHPVIIEHRLRSGEDIEATLDPMLAFALRALGARKVEDKPSP